MRLVWSMNGADFFLFWGGGLIGYGMIGYDWVCLFAINMIDTTSSIYIYIVSLLSFLLPHSTSLFLSLSSQPSPRTDTQNPNLICIHINKGKAVYFSLVLLLIYPSSFSTVLLFFFFVCLNRLSSSSSSSSSLPTLVTIRDFR